METSDKIVLVDKEGGRQEVDSRVLEMSEYIKEKKSNHDIENNTLVLDNISGTTLSRIITFCTYHLDNPLAEIERPLKSSNMRDVVSEWDANFINISVDELMDLIVAANFLIIQPLLDVACAKVASLIKGKSPEEIRTTFKIVSDFTPEEEAKVGSIRRSDE